MINAALKWGLPILLISFLLIQVEDVEPSTQSSQTQVQGVVSHPTSSPLSSPTIAPEIIFGEPQHLVIPALNIYASIEPVGQDEQGRMDVPKNDFNVSWWKLGSKPGALGSAVMAGHLDTPTGSAAVFYNLEKLNPGDEVQVIDDKGQIVYFTVTGKDVFADTTFPINEIFLDNTGKYLNLITCEGLFDRSALNYEDRLVVYTKMIE